MSLEEMKGIELPHPLSQGDNTEDLSKRYLQEPDYDRPILEVSSDDKERLTARLTHLYGIEAAKKCCSEIEHILQIFYAYKSREMIALDKEFDPAQRFTEKDIILITYGDLIQSEDSLPLETLSRFSKRYFNHHFVTLYSTVLYMPTFWECAPLRIRRIARCLHFCNGTSILRCRDASRVPMCRTRRAMTLK